MRRSQASNAAPSRTLGIDVRAVAKRRRRETVDARETGPRELRSTVPREEEEAIVVAFLPYSLLPLDGDLHALPPTIPKLTRSCLQRGHQRHGISRLLQSELERPARRRLANYPIGCFHIDLTEAQTAEGRL